MRLDGHDPEDPRAPVTDRSATDLVIEPGTATDWAPDPATDLVTKPAADPAADPAAGGPGPASARVALPAVLSDLVGFLLRQAFERTQLFGRAAMPPGRHPKEFTLLATLAAVGPTSQQALADRLGVNRTVMVKFIDGLEAAGFATRARNPADRRSYALSITPRGTAALEELRDALGHSEAALTASLTGAQRDRLRDLLAELVHARAGLADDLPPVLFDHVSFLVVQAHGWLREHGRAALRPVGIHPRHFAALAVLADAGAGTQQDLARQLGVSGTIVVGLADELEARGLVERRRTPMDRRSYALTVTDAGRATLARARSLIAVEDAKVTETLGPDRARELNALLRALVEAPLPPGGGLAGGGLAGGGLMGADGPG